jgi:hypothetical protein
MFKNLNFIIIINNYKLYINNQTSQSSSSSSSGSLSSSSISIKSYLTSFSFTVWLFCALIKGNKT